MANVVEIDVRANDQTKGFAGVKDGLSKALSGLGGIAKAAGADLASSLAGPIVAGAGVAVAAFASVGAAAGAFALAVKPQFAGVKAATELYTKATASAAAGSASAAKDMKAYKAALADLPPATRATAVAFVGLQSDFKKWSDSLAPKTMPIFTQGINILRTLLPSLTPLVTACTGALSGFMGTLQKDASGGGIQKFTQKLADAARVILPAFLSSLRNVAIGFGGILSAFLPFSGTLGGGLESLTSKFADFGKSLGSNPAFIKFMDDAKSKGPGVVEMLVNLAKTVFTVAQALAPFTGLTLVVAQAFAKLIASIPQGTMDWLAPTIGAIVLAIRAWAVVQGILNIALAANPIGLVVIAIAALVGGLIYAYKHSETFRQVVNSAWSGIKEAVTGAWGVLQPIFKKFASWFKDAQKPMEEFASFIKTNVVAAIDDVVKGISGIGDSIKGIPKQLDALKGLGGKGNSGKDKGNGALSAVAKPFEKLASTIEKVMNGLFKWMDSHWDDALDGISKVVGTWSKAMQTLWSKPWNWIIKFSAGFWAILTAIAIKGIQEVIHGILSPWPGVQKSWDAHMRGLPTAAAHMVVKVIQAIGRLPGQISSIASRMWGSIPRSLSGALISLGKMLGSVKGRVTGAFSGSGGWLSSAGRAIMNGLTSGISAGIGHVKSLLNSVTNLIPSWKGPPAKDIKLLHEAGHLIMQGLLNGIEGQVSAIKSKMAEVTSAIRKSFSGHQEDALVAYVKKTTNQLVALADKRDALAKRLADAKAFAADTAKNMMGFASLSGLGANSGQGLRAGLQDRLDKMRAFVSAIGQLKAKHLANSLLQQVIDQGPEGGLQLAQQLLSSDAGTFKSINNLQSQISKAASSIGNTAADAMFDTAKTRKALDAMQDRMDKLAERFAKKIRNAFHVKGVGITGLGIGSTGHAAGGPGGGWSMVGEQGRELVRLPSGSTVIPHGQTESMMAGGNGSSSPLVIMLRIGNEALGELIIDPLRKSIATRGGSVQAVLGR